MKKDYTDITIVLDRSGSMESIKTDTIGGFNEFIKKQKAVPGTATISLFKFDHVFESEYDGRDLQKAPELTQETYVPRGSTALVDAICEGIDRAGKRLKHMDDRERPEKIVFVIITDGYENASVKYAMKDASDRIQHQTDKYGWQFLFLGANQDAIATAAGYGISRGQTLTYAANRVGTNAFYNSVSDNIASYRTGKKKDASFEEKDRDEQTKAGA